MNSHDSSAEALGALCRMVHDDPALQAELFALEDSTEFVAAVQRLAASAGHALEEGELLQVMAAADRAWFERMVV